MNNDDSRIKSMSEGISILKETLEDIKNDIVYSPNKFPATANSEDIQSFISWLKYIDSRIASLEKRINSSMNLNIDEFGRLREQYIKFTSIKKMNAITKIIFILYGILISIASCALWNMI